MAKSDSPIEQRAEAGENGGRNHWIFGYGSLIWRPGFDWLERRTAVVDGWQRRFWQGSHDHRGTPQAPGRVVTLVPAAGTCCSGMAYRIDGATLHEVFGQLDLREQNGYRRVGLPLRFDDAASADGITYIAGVGNPAWLGAASAEAMARQIAASHGPSGSNRDYLLRLADALVDHGFDDEHVAELAQRVRSMRDEP